MSGPCCWNCRARVAAPTGGFNHKTRRWDCGAEGCRPASGLRSPLLEVIAGVPIVLRVTDPTIPRPGDKGRLELGGPIVEVDRVTDNGLYFHRVYDPPVIREFGGEALEAALPALSQALEAGTADEAYKAARQAAHAAGEYKSIRVSRGPVEPAVSKLTTLYPV